MSLQNREAVNRGISNQRFVALDGSSGIEVAVAQLVLDQGASAVIASSSPNRIRSNNPLFDEAQSAATAGFSFAFGDLPTYPARSHAGTLQSQQPISGQPCGMAIESGGTHRTYVVG